MKIMFMGTPDFAKTNLETLVLHGYDVCCAVTQQDKPQGRKMVLTSPPVKEYALSKNIPVLQPHTLKDGAFLKELEKYNPDLIVVVAYGKILPKYILDYPKYGCINVHGSLLPKYRGSAPVQWAVINGDKETGVTTMYMNEGMDTGDILLQQKFDILENETSGELMDRMAEIGAKLLVKTLENLSHISPLKQDENDVTYAPMLKKEMGLIKWDKSADQIKNLVDGLNPWPTAYFETEKGVIKIYSADVISCEMTENPGTVVSAGKTLDIMTGDGVLKIKELQLQGKKRMNAADFLRGCKIEKGMKF